MRVSVPSTFASTRRGTSSVALFAPWKANVVPPGDQDGPPRRKTGGVDAPVNVTFACAEPSAFIV